MDKENALIGYQVAVSLWGGHATEVAARFNVMVVVNSVLIAAMGLASTASRPMPLFSIVTPWLGILLCVLWYLLVRRDAEFTDYYMLSARELEEHYLAPQVKTLSRGGSLAEGKLVTLTLPGTLASLRLTASARVLRVKHSVYAVILLFAIFYLMAIFVFPP